MVRRNIARQQGGEQNPDFLILRYRIPCTVSRYSGVSFAIPLSCTLRVTPTVSAAVMVPTSDFSYMAFLPLLFREG